MKKRMVSLLLVVCLMATVVLFTGCESAESLVKGAIAKTSMLDSYEAEIEMQLDMEASGMTMSIPMTIGMKVKDAHGDNPIISANTAISMLGQSIEMDVYSDGEWIYLVSEGEGYKVSAENGDEYDYTGDVDDMIQNIPEDLLKDAEIVKNDDGSKSVTVALPDEVFAEVYKEFVDSMNETATGSEVEDIEISDAVVSITVKDGYISVYDISFEMNMTVVSLETSMDVKATITFKNPGQDVPVTPPDGYKDFEEMKDTSIA